MYHHEGWLVITKVGVVSYHVQLMAVSTMMTTTLITLIFSALLLTLQLTEGTSVPLTVTLSYAPAVACVP